MTDYTKQLVEQRRELHQWPEEGWTEFWTTNYIVNKLRSWGYEVLLGTKIINPEQVFGRNENSFRKALRTPWPAEFLSLSLTKPKATLARCFARHRQRRPDNCIPFRYRLRLRKRNRQSRTQAEQRRLQKPAHRLYARLWS